MRIPLMLIALSLAACGGGSGGGPSEAPVNITSTGFSNASITIPSGGRVHFFNKDTAAHTVTSSCSALNTSAIAPGGDFLCPTMTGPLNCSYSDASNASHTGSVAVSAPGSGGGGSGY